MYYIRDILFRGRDIITGNYAFGYFYISKGNAIIRDNEDKECIVIPESVGQYIGSEDRCGNKIFEGCAIEVYTVDGTFSRKDKVIFHKGAFVYEKDDDDCIAPGLCEVINSSEKKDPINKSHVELVDGNYIGSWVGDQIILDNGYRINTKTKIRSALGMTVEIRINSGEAYYTVK